MYFDYNETEQKGIRDVRNLVHLTTDEDHYKSIKTMISLIIIILNMKVKEIKIKFYQLDNILI